MTDYLVGFRKPNRTRMRERKEKEYAGLLTLASGWFKEESKDKVAFMDMKQIFKKVTERLKPG